MTERRKVELRDVASIPNAVSVLGLVLVVRGAARGDTGPGIAMVVAGRLLDLLDGQLARKLNQSSQFGAGLDAIMDKGGVLAIGVNEWRKRLAPRPALVLIGGQNLVNLVATGILTRLSPDELVPVRNGKSAMAYQNGALGAYAVSTLYQVRQPLVSRVFALIGHVNTAVGVGWFGVPASRDYVVRIVHAVRERRGTERR